MTVCDIIVIGGGPAGMMAAGKAAERGAAVITDESSVEVSIPGRNGGAYLLK